MSDNSVNKSISIPIEDEEEIVQAENTFPLAIRELGEALFENYEDKTSNISDENILGMIRCRAINDFMQERYGFRYSVLDKIVEDKLALNLSRNGVGITNLIEIVKSIQATFQQTQIPNESLGSKMMKR